MPLMITNELIYIKSKKHSFHVIQKQHLYQKVCILLYSHGFNSCVAI